MPPLENLYYYESVVRIEKKADIFELICYGPIALQNHNADRGMVALVDTSPDEHFHKETQYNIRVYNFVFVCIMLYV